MWPIPLLCYFWKEKIISSNFLKREESFLMTLNEEMKLNNSLGPVVPNLTNEGLIYSWDLPYVYHISNVYTFAGKKVLLLLNEVQMVFVEEILSHPHPPVDKEEEEPCC